MLPDRVSNQEPLTYESGALPIALCGPAQDLLKPLQLLKSGSKFGLIKGETQALPYLFL